MKRLLIALFSLSLLAACKKEDLPEPEPVENDPYKDYHMEHQINGSTQSFFNSGSDYNFESSSYGSPYTIDSVQYFNVGASSAGFGIDSGGNGGARISFEGYEDVYETYMNNKAQAIANICSLGSHPFTYDPQGPTAVSIQVYYDSILYVSYLGTQPETSAFTVTESTAITGSSTYFSRNVKGTYSCRLFKQSNAAEFIDITDGKFYLSFGTP